MLIIAALIALFASQSPASTEPAAKRETVPIEVQTKEVVKEIPKAESN